MKNKFTLPNGLNYSTAADGRRVCTGAQMGRRAYRPSEPNLVVKLRLVRLPFVDGCYDRRGAYWGCPQNVWCATNRVDAQCGYRADGADGAGQLVEVFVRADDRVEAKANVRLVLTGAQFYR